MGGVRTIGVLWLGQSNQQGATLSDNGGTGALRTSAATGNAEPYWGNANGGGSCLPVLEDFGAQRGKRYIIFNGAIGGAAIEHFCGVVGATVTGGSAATPVAARNMSGVGLTAGTGVPAVEGGGTFDPFGMLARARAALQSYPQITEWIGMFANAESNGGSSTAFYQACHISIANYLFTSGCRAYFAGLSASGNNSQANMDTLSAGVTGAIQALRATGKNAHRGPDLYAQFGMNPGLYDERFAPGTRVHLNDATQYWQGILAGRQFDLHGF